MCVGLHMCLHICRDPRLVLAYALRQGSQSYPELSGLANLTGHLTLRFCPCLWGWTNWHGRPASPTWQLHRFWGSELQFSYLCDKCCNHWAISPPPNFSILYKLPTCKDTDWPLVMHSGIDNFLKIFLCVCICICVCAWVWVWSTCMPCCAYRGQRKSSVFTFLLGWDRVSCWLLCIPASCPSTPTPQLPDPYKGTTEVNDKQHWLPTER